MKMIVKKIFGFTVIITLCLGVFFSVSCEKSVQEPHVSFTPCRQEILKSSNFSGNVDIAFTDKGVEIKQYNFAVTCDFTAVNVSHTFVNGVLSITQQGFPNQARCICYTDVSYTIEGISQNEVNVIFINGVQVYCHNENSIYENHDVSVCGVNDPLQNIEWLKEYCSLVIETQYCSNVYIELYRVIGADEYLFKATNAYSELDDAPFRYSADWKNCSGEIIIRLNSGVPPPDVYERNQEFLKDKKYVCELFHFVRQ